MQASFDGLIYGPVKGQIHWIDMEQRCTGAALEANPMITLTVLGTHAQLASGCGMSNSHLLIALFCTNVLGRINPTIMETIHDPSSRAPNPISVLPLFSFILLIS